MQLFPHWHEGSRCPDTVTPVRHRRIFSERTCYATVGGCALHPGPARGTLHTICKQCARPLRYRQSDHTWVTVTEEQVGLVPMCGASCRDSSGAHRTLSSREPGVFADSQTTGTGQPWSGWEAQLWHTRTRKWAVRWTLADVALFENLQFDGMSVRRSHTRLREAWEALYHGVTCDEINFGVFYSPYAAMQVMRAWTEYGLMPFDPLTGETGVWAWRPIIGAA